ncbi:hypothetical protein ATANTOWER_017405 [Ataeniobius toweri]|uniref:Uncharacterized protein n=1 Tax=Ataeniobius toweri TaxID=208326 RepID=A0ABU7A7A1_9TELE|nr:hypothetical protein [Ataeniobius toweri]
MSDDAEMFSKSDGVDRKVTFSLGMGQRHMSFGRGRPVPSSEYEYSVDRSVMNHPPVPAASSTPIGKARPELGQLVSTEVLSGVIANLVKQIGDAISSNLSGLHLQSHALSQVADSQPSEQNDQSVTNEVCCSVRYQSTTIF